MEVVVSVQHPAHVHFFKHAIEELRNRGHETHVYALDKDITRELLEANDIDHTVLTDREPDDSVVLTQLGYEIRLLRAVRGHDPDVMTAIGGVAASHVAALVGARCVVFTDTAHATVSNSLAFPFADTICTPTCYRGDAGPKQYAYPGYHELAYLHPNRFTPSTDAFDDIDIDPDETFVVLRLTRWNAVHSSGRGGFADLDAVVDRLESTGARVLVTSEDSLPESIDRERTQVPPHRMHDVLAYADLFVGESPTMAAESAILGTPAVYAHNNATGLTQELGEYGLVFPCHGPTHTEDAIDRAVEILDGDFEDDWGTRREELLADRRDTTEVIVERLLETGRL